MSHHLCDAAFEQLVRKLYPSSRLLRAWQLTGGVSAQVTAVQMEDSHGRTKTVVVRQHGEADLAANPHIARDEFALLHCLQSAGVAVPGPYFYDESGQILPSPFVVVDYVEGSTDHTPIPLTDVVGQLATHLVAIHTVQLPPEIEALLPSGEVCYEERIRHWPTGVDSALSDPPIREAIQTKGRLVPRNARCLLHGDFWPGNVLWRGGRIAAVIDWEDAQVGDPLADLANCRLEVLWALGLDAMNAFTDHYRSLLALDFTDLPYWDIFAALRSVEGLSTWGHDSATEEHMRKERSTFVRRAYEMLSRPSLPL